MYVYVWLVETEFFVHEKMQYIWKYFMFLVSQSRIDLVLGGELLVGTPQSPVSIPLFGCPENALGIQQK